MALVTTKVINGRVVRKGDKCWGDTYTDAHGGVRAQGWVDIYGADIGCEISISADRKGKNYLTKPSDKAPISGSYVEELNEGRVVSVTRIVHTIVHENIIDEV